MRVFSGSHTFFFTAEKLRSSKDSRDLGQALVSIKNRLELSMVVYHPVIFGETITTSNEDAKMKQLKSKLEWAIDELAVLFEEDCTKKAALKAWRSVFNDSYFDELIENESVAKSFSILSSTPSEPVQKKGGGRFG
jgi:hypothetical protein